MNCENHLEGSPSPECRGARRCCNQSGRIGRYCVVNVLLLRSVHSYQRFDRLDHTLRVPHEIAVDFLRGHVLDDPTKQLAKMQDFAMSTAHFSETMTLAQNLCKLRIDAVFVIALVFHDAALNKFLSFPDQRPGGFGRLVVQRIHDPAQAVEVPEQRLMIVM